LACWTAAFGANWGLSLALSWQGAYLIKGLGLAQSSIGFLGALGAGGSAVVMLATGWYSQRLLLCGVSSRLARGILGGLSVVLGGAALAMLPYLPGTPVKIALTTLGVALPSAIFVISNAVVGEITPAAQRGALLAIGAAVASSAGLLAPYIMGSVIESATTPLDGFNTGFFICGVIMLVGGGIAVALVNPEREAKRRARRLQLLTAST
jgi:MFS family permease